MNVSGNLFCFKIFLGGLGGFILGLTLGAPVGLVLAFLWGIAVGLIVPNEI